MMVLPPAVLEKVCAKILEGASESAFKKWVFEAGLESGERSLAVKEGVGANWYIIIWGRVVLC